MTRRSFIEDVRALARETEAMSHEQVEILAASLIAYRVMGDPLPEGATVQGLGLLMLRVSMERERLLEEVIELRAAMGPVSLE